MKYNLPKVNFLKFFIGIIFIIHNLSGIAQNGTNNLDPLFPIYIVGEDNAEMQMYAKTHPPAPDSVNFENSDNYQGKLEEWLSLNPYYPQLIPYHLYKGGLTPQDDILFYEKAIVIWNNAHPGSLENLYR